MSRRRLDRWTMELFLFVQYVHRRSINFWDITLFIISPRGCLTMTIGTQKP